MQLTDTTLCKERHLRLTQFSIRGAMLDELRSRDWVPRSVRRNAREVAHAMGQLEQELGRNATETEVAERLGIAVEEYRQMLLDTNNSQLFSYDEWREEHGDSIELVTDEHQQENPLHHLMEGNLRQRVWKRLKLYRNANSWFDPLLSGRA
jgi:RNA polymerase sigma factor for flagellar operon FliA